MSTNNGTAAAIRKRNRSPEDVVARIQRGDSVIVSGGAAQPQSFLNALGARDDLQGVTVYTAMTIQAPVFLEQQMTALKEGTPMRRGTRICSFQVGPGERGAAQNALVDLVPVDSAEVGAFFRQRRVDVLVLGLSRTDDEGRFSLGTNVQWLPQLLEQGHHQGATIVGELNNSMPCTQGPTHLGPEVLDYIIEVNRPVPELPPGEPPAEAASVGAYLASLVPDGATIQVGLGSMARWASLYLESKKDLGVHTDVITDTLLYLYEKGAITGRKKGFLPGKWVGSHVLGSGKLYRFVDGNAMITLMPTETVSAPSSVGRNNLMVSIEAALQVDLTGQVSSDGGEYPVATNPGLQRAFHKAAAHSQDGKGIVVMASTAGDGKNSRIVPQLAAGASVSIPRGDVDRVVSEYGVAELKGRSSMERALNLIAIAHPNHRDRLAFEARKIGLLD